MFAAVLAGSAGAGIPTGASSDQQVLAESNSRFVFSRHTRLSPDHPPIESAALRQARS